MADAEAARAAREATVGDQRNLVACTLAVKRRGGGQHLAHAGAALGALVADDEDVAVLVGAVLDGGETVLLTIEHQRRTAKLQLGHAGYLDDGAFWRQRTLPPPNSARMRPGP